MRGRRRRAALAFLGCLAIAGCGEGATDSGGDGEAATALTITLDADGDGGESPRQTTLSCPGGEASSCAAAAALPADPAAPVPPQTACTEIYGGPDTLTIDGTLDGEQVQATLTRANGCEIERFDRFSELVAALFPDYEPGAALGPQ